jgi:hypothetical protein
MTRLAAVPVFKGGLEMRCIFKVLFVQVLMTRLAGIHANVLSRLIACCSRNFVLLVEGKRWLKQKEEQYCSHA